MDTASERSHQQMMERMFARQSEEMNGPLKEAAAR
jgi:hypothetical protein